MHPAATVKSGLKLVILTILLFLLFSAASSLLGLQSAGPKSNPEQVSVALTLFLVCFIYTCLISYLIFRSRWYGWRLIMTIIFVFYGIMTVMSQLESMIFLPHILPSGTIGKLFLLGAIIAFFFSPAAVLILGKMKAGQITQTQNFRLLMSKREWVWKLIIIAGFYPILYFTFGWFIAWQSPAVREFYVGVSLSSWLPIFQIPRAFMWTALALPVIRMLKGPWWESAMMVGLMFAVLMNAQLLFPNPYMPEPVRIAHLVETASSNAIFGWIIVWLLNRHHTSVKDLFQW